ncbi:MAG: nucleotidyltransferase family protein [Pseudomonadota bacterium]
MTSVLILAGTRDEACPLCRDAKVESKALVPLGGVRMVDHMLRALRDSPSLTGDIWISGLCPEELVEGAPMDLVGFLHRVRAAPAAIGPAKATYAALDAGATFPLLVTTCDHPLLNPSMIDAFLSGADAVGCDAAVGLARQDVIQAAYPETQRTYLKLAGEGYSGCNLFLLRTDNARKGAEFWHNAEVDRKRPLKLVRRFGLGALLRMLTGRLPLLDAFEHGSRRIGASVAPIIFPIPEAAIDVDKPSDLVLVRQIMKLAS